MSISLALELKLSLINSAGSDCTSSRQARWVGGGGDYLREAIILNISVWGTQLIEGWLLFEGIWWFECYAQLRGGEKKCKREKEEGVPAIRTCVFACCPPGSQMSTVTTWPSTFHFSVYRNVNNVLEKGITDSWGQIPPKSKHLSSQNGQDWIPPNKNGNYVMGLAQYIYENERQAASSTCQFQGDFSVFFLIFFRGFHINIKRNDQQL